MVYPPVLHRQLRRLRAGHRACEKWWLQLVTLQHPSLFRRVLIYFSYRAMMVPTGGNAPPSSAYQADALLLSYAGIKWFSRWGSHPRPLSYQPSALLRLSYARIDGGQRRTCTPTPFEVIRFSRPLRHACPVHYPWLTGRDLLPLSYRLARQGRLATFAPANLKVVYEKGVLKVPRSG